MHEENPLAQKLPTRFFSYLQGEHIVYVEPRAW